MRRPVQEKPAPQVPQAPQDEFVVIDGQSLQIPDASLHGVWMYNHLKEVINLAMVELRGKVALNKEKYKTQAAQYKADADKYTADAEKHMAERKQETIKCTTMTVSHLRDTYQGLDSNVHPRVLSRLMCYSTNLLLGMTGYIVPNDGVSMSEGALGSQ
jgi:hypothetical protein